jgi:hypothetical protein
MAKIICAECGEANDFDAEFCAYCHAFLAWDDADRAAGQQGAQQGARSGGAGERSPASGEQAIETQVMPRFQVVPDPPVDGRGDVATSTPTAERDTTDGLFRIRTEQGAVTVPATGEPAILMLRITNTSMIVDGYAVAAVEAPAWLVVESDQIQLLPNTEEALQVRLRIGSATLVPAQVLRTALRVTSMAQAPAHADIPVEVTVPVVDVPVQLRAEPRLLRVRDRDTAEFTVFADNSRSNRAVQLRFAGSDPELAVRFQFSPPVLDLGPGAAGSVQVVATAAAPEPGTEVSRALTVSAADGDRSVDTLVTLQQLTSARVEDPPVELEAQPSLVRVRDTTVGMLRLIADNRGGKEWARLQLRATDPERVVRVSWAVPQLDVPPGEAVYVDARLQAPLPDPGTEVSRTLTVTAENGPRTSTTSATFVQVASASPMATLVIRTDPSVVRVADSDSATSQVLVDNRRSRTAVRVFLTGTDPERAIRFSFPPSAVEVGAGQVLAVPFRMDAWRPQPGQEVSRPFTITASDGDQSVETSGSLVQTSSRAAIETLALQLDPTVLRLGSRRRGVLTAVVDNRKGSQPVRVGLRGDDPENSLRFAFTPNVIEVAPGRLARTAVTVRAPGVPGGREVTRPFLVAASDGQSEVVAEGNLVQAATERRPLARVLFTLFGGLGMILGGFLPFWSGTINAPDGGEATAFDLHANLVAEFFANATLGSTGNQVLDALITGTAQVASAGLIMVVLGVVAIFGLTGPRGRLTRLAAFVGFVFVVLLFIAFAVGGVNGNVEEGPGPGALLLAAGCVSAYVGGLLVRR